MASFVRSFFPLDVLDEIWDLIVSVSEGFLTYSYSFMFIRPPIFKTKSSYWCYLSRRKEQNQKMLNLHIN